MSHGRSWFPWRTLFFLVGLCVALALVFPGLRGTVVAWGVSALAVAGSLLVVGSVAFWVFGAVLLVTLAYVSSDDWLEDHELIPLIVLLGAGLALWLFGNFNIFRIVWRNPGEALLWALGYIAVGAVYSVLKYKKYARRIGRECLRSFETEKKNFYYDFKISENEPIPSQHATAWKSLVSRFDRELKADISLDRNKSRIMTWIYCWAFNSLTSFVRNPLRWLSKAVWYALRDIYERIARSVVAEFGNFGGGVKVGGGATVEIFSSEQGSSAPSDEREVFPGKYGNCWKPSNHWRGGDDVNAGSETVAYPKQDNSNSGSGGGGGNGMLDG